MTGDDYEFGERISRDLEARRAARLILGVEEGVSMDALKKAYRRASLKYHPDRNRNDDKAEGKFKLVKCAYELLAEDKPCPSLAEEAGLFDEFPKDDRYELDNLWGHFLWWRDKFSD